MELINASSSNAKTRKEFKGVFPSDCLPKQKLKKPAFVLANTQDRFSPGMHWIASEYISFGFCSDSLRLQIIIHNIILGQLIELTLTEFLDFCSTSANMVELFQLYDTMKIVKLSAKTHVQSCLFPETIIISNNAQYTLSRTSYNIIQEMRTFLSSLAMGINTWRDVITRYYVLYMQKCITKRVPFLTSSDFLPAHNQKVKACKDSKDSTDN